MLFQRYELSQDLLVLVREFKISVGLETRFVKLNPCDNKVEITFFDNYINSPTLNNDFKKLSMQKFFPIACLTSGLFLGLVFRNSQFAQQEESASCVLTLHNRLYHLVGSLSIKNVVRQYLSNVTLSCWNFFSVSAITAKRTSLNCNRKKIRFL